MMMRTVRLVILQRQGHPAKIKSTCRKRGCRGAASAQEAARASGQDFDFGKCRSSSSHGVDHDLPWYPFFLLLLKG